MLKKIVAAIILVCVSVFTTGAQAEWPQHRGRGRGYRGRGRGRGWGHYRPDPGVGGFIGGVFGSWLWNQMNKDEEPPSKDYDDGDDQERDRR